MELEISAWQPRREDRPCGDPALCLPTWRETMIELSWWLKTLRGGNHSWEKKTFQLPVLINLLVSASVPCLPYLRSHISLWVWTLGIAEIKKKFFFSEEKMVDVVVEAGPLGILLEVSLSPVHRLPSLLGRASPELLLSSLLVVLSLGQLLWS